jgi:hypothetical protein
MEVPQLHAVDAMPLEVSYAALPSPDHRTRMTRPML